MLKTGVYLDHNATTPLHPEIKTKVGEWLGAWGNPSSIHWAGREPKRLLREARRNIAGFLGVEPLELVFTSGGSEANNLALKGLMVESRVAGRDQIVISAVEHPSLRQTAEALARQCGVRVDVVPVDRAGRLDMDRLSSLLSERTLLVSVMLANNETGHIFPVQEISALAHGVGAVVHCDAVQGLGKIPLRLPEWGVDMASFSGHKFYSLKGCGVLFIRRGLHVASLIHGGGQERGRRAGTENLLAVASLGFMCGEKRGEAAEQSARLKELRDDLEKRIVTEIEGSRVTGGGGVDGGPRLPTTTSLVLDGVDGETLLMNLDVKGYAVSTGAACSSGSPEPSPVLLAMGLSREEAQSSLRLSLGWSNTRAEIDRFVEDLKEIVSRLRAFKHGQRHSYGI